MKICQICSSERKSAVAPAAAAPYLPPPRPIEAGGEALAWMSRAGDLADWAFARVVVRRDAYVAYCRVFSAEGVEVEQRTIKRPLTRELLIDHFGGDLYKPRLAVHTISPICPTCKVTVVDVDAHRPDDDPEANWKFVREVERRAAGRGLVTRIFSTDGAGSFHVWAFHPRPIPCAEAHRFGKWLIRDWEGFGLRGEPETFPKSPGLTGKGFGTTIRLPGRHPRRAHWTGVWDGETDDRLTGFLRGADAVAAVLEAGGRAARVPLDPLVPTDFVLPAEAACSAARVRILDPEELDREAARAREALACLGPEYFESYEKWLEVGMALKQLGEPGLAIWHEWSAQSRSRYRPDELERKWETFAPPADESPAWPGRRPRTIGLGTLFKWAREEGWKPPGSTARPMAEEAEICRKALLVRPEALTELASRLEVGEGALRKLGVGWREENRRPGIGGCWEDDGPAWTFPLSDGAGEVVGLLRRYEAETIADRLVRGSKMGLFVPAGWQRGCGPVLVPEGIDNVVALVGAGCCTIGRLEGNMGVEDLARLLRGVDREIVVVAVDARDDKGRWSGKERAEEVARGLSNRLGRRVKKWLPREGGDGARKFIRSRRVEHREG